jgi:hypothetical protein
VRPPLIFQGFRSPWLNVPLLAALLCRALTPLGYMPGPGGLMLCPAYAPLPSALAARHAAATSAGVTMLDMNIPGMEMPAMATHGHHHHAPASQAPGGGGDGTGMGHGGMGICPFAGAATLMAAMRLPPALQQFLLFMPFAPAVPDFQLPPAPSALAGLPRGPPALA